jgi:cytochrome P450
MGFHIPKGATVVGSHWSISTDEKMFDERYEFRPERWMKIQVFRSQDSGSAGALQGAACRQELTIHRYHSILVGFGYWACD